MSERLRRLRAGRSAADGRLPPLASPLVAFALAAARATAPIEQTAPAADCVANWTKREQNGQKKSRGHIAPDLVPIGDRL